MATKSKKPKKKSGGLTPQTFKGMSPQRFKSKGGGGYQKRLPLKKGATIPVLFLDRPDDFKEYEVHAFQEAGRWHFVPHAEEGCPLCESDSEQVSRRSYRFCANVYNLEAKKVQVLEGGSNLAVVVHAKHAAKPSVFRKRVYDLTMFPTQPVSFQLERSDDEPPSAAKIAKLQKHELDEYILGEMKAYYGDDLSNIDLSSSLDDDDDEDDDDWEEEEEDDEDEDDEPPRRKKSSSKKSKRR